MKEVETKLDNSVNEGLALKADTVDVMQNKQSIATLESILSDVNINQEAQVTTSGASPLSLPKNAANGGMSVKLEGLTAENLIVNGDFRNGTTGWDFGGSGINSIVDTNLRNTGTTGTKYPYIVKNFTLGVQNDKIYIAFTYRFNAGSKIISARVSYYSNSKTITLIDIPKVEEWTMLSGIATLTGTASNTYNFIYHNYESTTDADGQYIEINSDFGYKVINLTATFGAGNEPTKEQCDKLFANYFEGTANTIGTGRVRSVGVGGINPSSLYFNGGTLRSNGLIKDEIRKGANGYELVKRISEVDGTVLANPTITPIAHAGLLNSNSNGTVYFEPAVADAGVYGANIAIQLTDFPISAIESISKYEDGVFIPLNTATAVIAVDGLSFTHPDLASGDLVTFTYMYNLESTGRSMTLTHYDSRYVVKDTANADVYKITPKITSGELTWELTLV